MLKGINGAAFIAGKIDGDGYINADKREIYIGYSEKKINDALKDAAILDNLGIEYKLTKSKGIIKLRIHKPRSAAELLHPYILHSKKIKQINKLLKK